MNSLNDLTVLLNAIFNSDNGPSRERLARLLVNDLKSAFFPAPTPKKKKGPQYPFQLAPNEMCKTVAYRLEEWIEDAKICSTNCAELSYHNKLPLIRRLRELADKSYNPGTGGYTSTMGLKEAKDTIELVFSSLLK